LVGILGLAGDWFSDLFWIRIQTQQIKQGINYNK
jgi:hypothetical protein